MRAGEECGNGATRGGARRTRRAARRADGRPRWRPSILVEPLAPGGEHVDGRRARGAARPGLAERRRLARPGGRFTSAYTSKCVHAAGDHDGRLHCERYLGLPKGRVAADDGRGRGRAAAEYDRDYAACGWNAHWAPQACFCGGLADDFAKYSQRIHMDAAALRSGVRQLLEGRVPAPRLADALAELSNSTTAPPRKLKIASRQAGAPTAAAAPVVSTASSPALRASLREMYAADYAMLRAAAADTAFACRPEHEAAMQRDVAAHARLPPVNALIVALVRNEGAWLPEWIEHHALLGVGRFALYDDGSADETAAVLAPYVEAGLVVLHHVGDYCLGDYNVNQSYSSSHNFLQQPVMLRHAAAVHAARSRWVVFVDADEYIWIGDGRRPASLPDLLERVSARPGAAAEPYAGVWLHGADGRRGRWRLLVGDDVRPPARADALLALGQPATTCAASG